MRNYLSQIVAKTNGMSESTPMKPGIRSWPPSHSEKSSDPFEEVVEPSKDITMPEFSSGQTVFLKNTDSLTPNQGSEEMISPGKTAEQFHIPLAQSARLMPHVPSSDSTVSLSPLGKKNKLANIEQSIVNRTSEDNEQPILRHTEKPGKVIFDSENPAPVRPVFVEPNVTHEQHNPAIRESSKTILKPVRQATDESTATDLSPHESKTHEKKKQPDKLPVQELRPTAPITATLFSPAKPADTEPRLVIGRLKVEVLPPPVTTEQATVRTTTPHTGKSQPRREVSNSPYKLRFGLGQM